MIDKLLLTFVENYLLIFIGFVIIFFIISIIYSMIKEKKRKKSKDVLDKKTIMINYGSTLGIVLFIILFIIGLIIFYASIKSKITFNIIIGIFCSVVFCIIPSIIIISSKIKTATNILKGNYIIVEDELLDKKYSNNSNRKKWSLYFKEFFKTYNRCIYETSKGNEYKIGDKFYLVFEKKARFPNIYKVSEYKLEEKEKSKLMTLEEAKKYINLEEFVLKKETSKEKNNINPKNIINDFYNKKKKQKVIIEVALTLVLIVALIMTIKFYSLFDITTLILILLSIILYLITFLIESIVDIKCFFTIINDIKNNKYEIKEDEIISLNNNLSFSDSNTMISFKLKNYKKIVYEYKKDFLDTLPGDKLYLVFVKGKKEPIKVYNVKNSIIEKNK